MNKYARFRLPVQLWITTVLLFSILFIFMMGPIGRYLTIFCLVISIASLLLSLPALVIYLVILPALRNLAADIEHKLLLLCCLNVTLVLLYGIAVYSFLGVLFMEIASHFFLSLASASAIATSLYWNRLQKRYFITDPNETHGTEN